MPRAADTALGPIRRFLIGEQGDEPSLEQLRVATLSPLAHLRLPDHPEAASFRADYAEQTARHLMLRGPMSRLLGELHERGAEALVFKGFHLAEFVYDSPGLRVYADVDMLVRETDLAKLAQASEASGWNIAWRLGDADSPHAMRSARYHGHEIAQLEHPSLGFRVDVHRRPVHNLHNRWPAGPIRERLTEEMWSASSEADLDGAPVRVPSPADAAVFGLALNRTWGSDEWWVKPRDYADLQALAANCDLTREQIIGRAEELGVSRTVGAYLERCDPYRGVLVLEKPSAAELWRLDARLLQERGSRRLATAFSEILDMPVDAAALLRALRLVGEAQRVMAAERMGAPPVSAATRSLGHTEWRVMARGLRRAARLRGLEGDRANRVAVVAAYLALARRGHKAELREGPLGLEVTYDGVPLHFERVDE